MAASASKGKSISSFEAKVDLATSILTSFRERGNAPFTVLMDSWYTCAPILNLISASGGIYVAAIKRNRYVEINGVKVNARDGAAISGLETFTVTALEESEIVLVDAA